MLDIQKVTTEGPALESIKSLFKAYLGSSTKTFVFNLLIAKSIILYTNTARLPARFLLPTIMLYLLAALRYSPCKNRKPAK